MKAVLRRKRDLLQHRQVLLHRHLATVRRNARDKASSPMVLLAAFATGYFVSRMRAREHPAATEADQSTAIRPVTQRLTILGGILLGTAVRRSLRGMARDLLQAPAETRADHRNPA
ncbi:MAG: hypothetical protein WED00_07480 [Aquisalimonadaceae bacterium]